MSLARSVNEVRVQDLYLSEMAMDSEVSAAQARIDRVVKGLSELTSKPLVTSPTEVKFPFPVFGRLDRRVTHKWTKVDFVKDKLLPQPMPGLLVFSGVPSNNGRDIAVPEINDVS